MPRPRRICFPGALYHIIQRGNNKQNIFIDDIDRWYILKLLVKSKRQFEYRLYCYTLMGNHFHITIETPNLTPVSKIMQLVNGGYAAYFNKRHDRKGHLFEGRFKGIIVEKDTYFLELSRYVHLNAVRAGFVKLPEEYEWSSYNTYLGSRKDALVDIGAILSYFERPNMEDTKKAYKNFVEDGILKINKDKDWLEEKLINKSFLTSKSFFKNLQKRCLTP